MKRVIALLLVAALGCTMLTGCGPVFVNTETEDSATKEPTSSEETKPTDEEEEDVGNDAPISLDTIFVTIDGTRVELPEITLPEFHKIVNVDVSEEEIEALGEKIRGDVWSYGFGGNGKAVARVWLQCPTDKSVAYDNMHVTGIEIYQTSNEKPLHDVKCFGKYTFGDKVKESELFNDFGEPTSVSNSDESKFYTWKNPKGENYIIDMRVVDGRIAGWGIRITAAVYQNLK